MTDQTDPPSEAQARPDAAGWYPDPRDPQRYRYWDGDRWSELTSAEPFMADESTSEAAAAPRRRVWPWILGAVVVAALVAGGAVLVLDADDGDDSAASTATTSAPRPTTTDSPDSSEEPTTTTTPETTSTAPDGGETTVPLPSDPAPAPPFAGDPVAPCVVDGEVLLQKLREHPPLESFADRLSVSEVRCVGKWATAVTAASDTDESLAVFEASGDDWTLLLLGSSEPCAGLGIPAESQPLLRCGFPAP